ncbi:MAG: hypothetical protein JW993_16630 [Sedimentisphaerales bacterium]|nr:hypothetical protein [Sedimentisphaerales bacterium]
MVAVEDGNGVVLYYAPDSDSLAINHGSNSLAVDAQGQSLQTDIAGNPRILYDIVDIGAYEYAILGDTNHNGMVGQLDVFVVAENLYYGMPTGATWADGDFDRDNDVDDDDLYLLALHWKEYWDDPVQDEIPSSAVDQVFTDYGYNNLDPSDDITPEDEEWGDFVNELWDALGIIA